MLFLTCIVHRAFLQTYVYSFHSATMLTIEHGTFSEDEDVSSNSYSHTDIIFFLTGIPLSLSINVMHPRVVEGQPSVDDIKPHKPSGSSVKHRESSDQIYTSYQLLTIYSCIPDKVFREFHMFWIFPSYTKACKTTSCMTSGCRR